MKKILILSLIFLAGCIGEDIVMDEVAAKLKITNPISSMQVNTSYQFEYMLSDNTGKEVKPSKTSWTTSDASIATVSDQGLVTAVNLGTVAISITAEAGTIKADTSISFSVTKDTTASLKTERTGKIKTTSSYELTGDFTIAKVNNDLKISFTQDYIADDGLPGLYVYLTNNPNSPNDGHEIGPVKVFKGVHEYTLSNIDLFDYDYIFYYCKPFKVKVGDGKIN